MSENKVNKNICQSYSVPLLLLVYPIHFQRKFFNTSYSKTSQPVYTPVEKVLRKKGQKQVKKNAFKINAKIIELKSTEQEMVTTFL